MAVAAAQYRCGDARRRRFVRDASPATINGIDFLEVGPDQKTLEVTFLHNLPGEAIGVPASPALGIDNVVIDGGVRITDIRVTQAASADDVLTVTVDASGDFSTYVLRLRTSITDDSPPAMFDPQLSAVPFSFKVDCPNDFDCAVPDVCPPEVLSEPEIDYLAKDYDSFRQLMLDRMAALAPDWTERNPADDHVALVELLAYVGDHLSYYQDAVATESYLGTARLRVSARRHARLLDYRVHSGCNARAWVAFDVDSGSSADGQALDAGTVLLSRGDTDETTVAPADLPKVLLAERPTVFETMYAITLNAAHNAIGFYTWSDDQCCLPKGATHATLVDDPILALAVGDVVLFEEVRSPTTGLEADADPTHRHVVRLTVAEHDVDELDGTPVLEIGWARRRRAPLPALHLGSRRLDGGRDRGRARQCRARRSRTLDSVGAARADPGSGRSALPAVPRRRPAHVPGRLRPDVGRGVGDADGPPRRAAGRRRHGRGRDLDSAVRPSRQ